MRQIAALLAAFAALSVVSCQFSNSKSIARQLEDTKQRYSNMLVEHKRIAAEWTKKRNAEAKELDKEVEKQYEERRERRKMEDEKDRVRDAEWARTLESQKRRHKMENDQIKARWDREDKIRADKHRFEDKIADFKRRSRKERIEKEEKEFELRFPKEVKAAVTTVHHHIYYD